MAGLCRIVAITSLIIRTSFRSIIVHVHYSATSSPCVSSKDLRIMCRILCVALAVVLLGCGARSARVSYPSTISPPQHIAPEGAKVPPTGPVLVSGAGPDYLNLEPGWQLRVITPLLKSGGYRIEGTQQQLTGDTLTISAGDDFLGYETACYAIQPRRGGGVRIRFVSAEVTQEGETLRQPRPKVRLFQLPRRARFVRLIWLIRVSQADHDMAVVAADNMADLDLLTRKVRTNPAAACQSGDHSFCSWIPSGIAVRPERPVAAGGEE